MILSKHKNLGLLVHNSGKGLHFSAFISYMSRLCFLIHGHRNIKTVERAHSAECQSPGTKGGSLNFTGFSDRCQAKSLGGACAPGAPMVPTPMLY